jgi:predicted Fe-Mo cluster-binding NifX family protein
LPIRVAVATEDGKHVKEGEFNKAKYFAIYDVSGKSPTKVELRVNTRISSEDPSSALEILRDCEVVISKEFSRDVKEAMESMGLIAHETRNTDVVGAIIEFAEKVARLKEG